MKATVMLGPSATCPMAKIGQHFVGMLWTEQEHISGARRYVQHARPGGHIEERPFAVAQAEPTGGVARQPGTPPARARPEVRLARQIDDSRLLHPQRGPGYAASVDVAPKIETRVGENEARSLRAVCGQAEESHDGDKQQENGEQEIKRPHAGRYDLVHRLHDAYLGEFWMNRVAALAMAAVPPKPAGTHPTLRAVRPRSILPSP